MEAIQVLTCRLDQGLVAINIQHVREIQPVTACTPLPLSAPYIKGVVSIRDQLIPVMDLHVRFGWPAPAADQRLVVLDSGEARFAIIVDETKDVTDAQWDRHGDIPEEVDIPAAFLDGTCHVNGQAVPLLNPRTLIAESRQLAASRRNK